MPPLKIFVSYSKRDRSYLEQLVIALAPLMRQGVISPWNDHDILPGEEWDDAVKENLAAADMILLLVSSDFMANDYIWEVEIKKAMQRHNHGEATVVPIILRPCDWEHEPFAKLNALPIKGQPVSQFENQDEAWTEVAKRLRILIEQRIDKKRGTSINGTDQFDYLREKIELNRGSGTSQILKDKKVEDLDEDTLRMLFEREQTSTRFKELGIDAQSLTAHQKLVRLSLAENGHLYKGVFLCLAKFIQMQSVSFTAAETHFTLYKGLDTHYPLIIQDVIGNIVQQFNKIDALLTLHIPLNRDMKTRIDSFEIPPTAFREFLANAYVHRSYEPEVKSYVKVDLFDDRLEIINPGQFPSEINLEHISGSQIVNPTIAAVFTYLGYMEKRGTGIRRAQEELEAHGVQRAKIEQSEKPKFVKVTIFRKNYRPT